MHVVTHRLQGATWSKPAYRQTEVAVMRTGRRFSGRVTSALLHRRVTTGKHDVMKLVVFRLRVIRAWRHGKVRVRVDLRDGALGVGTGLAGRRAGNHVLPIGKAPFEVLR